MCFHDIEVLLSKLVITPRFLAILVVVMAPLQPQYNCSINSV